MAIAAHAAFVATAGAGCTTPRFSITQNFLIKERIFMANATLAFDHVHVISKDPHATAAWYVDKLGGKLVKSVVSHDAPQIYLSFGEAMIIVRGERPGERAQDKPGLEWGADHFGFQVKGDFDGYCAGLRAQGVAFSMEPTDIDPATRIAFIDAPDGVSVELLCRKAQP